METFLVRTRHANLFFTAGRASQRTLRRVPQTDTRRGWQNRSVLQAHSQRLRRMPRIEHLRETRELAAHQITGYRSSSLRHNQRLR